MCMYNAEFDVYNSCFQALYLLHQCGHNVEEASRRRRKIPAVTPAGIKLDTNQDTSYT